MRVSETPQNCGEKTCTIYREFALICQVRLISVTTCCKYAGSVNTTFIFWMFFTSCCLEMAFDLRGATVYVRKTQFLQWIYNVFLCLVPLWKPGIALLNVRLQLHTRIYSVADTSLQEQSKPPRWWDSSVKWSLPRPDHSHHQAQSELCDSGEPVSHH